MGAMSTGAAANDPIFWPIHPLFDRLWAYIRLAPEFSSFNHTWIDDESCNGRSLYDTMPWKDLLNEGDDKFYTNSDLYSLFDPTNPQLTYVYEHFGESLTNTDLYLSFDLPTYTLQRTGRRSTSRNTTNLHIHLHRLGTVRALCRELH